MACNFLGSSLTSSLDRMCPRKFISLDFLGKLTFRLVNKKFVLTELTQNILKVFYMFFYYLGVHQDIINIDDHKLVQFSWKIKFMKAMNIDGMLHNPNGINRNSYEPYLVFMRAVNIDGMLHNPNGISRNSYEPYLVFMAVFSTSSSTTQI
jgi:hypothetical protein